MGNGYHLLLYSGRTPMYFVHCAVVSTTAQWTITTAQWKLLLHSRQLHSYGLLTRVWQVDKPTALLGYPAALKIYPIAFKKLVWAHPQVHKAVATRQFVKALQARWNLQIYLDKWG